jgi:hypothetical protein
MAIPYTLSIPTDANGVSQYGCLLVSWAGLTEVTAGELNVGEPFDLCKYNLATVQLGGDDGTSGSISLEGTNIAGSVTDADYVTLTKKYGTTALTATTANIIGGVNETPLRIRPRVTAGTSVNMYCHMLVTSTHR